MQILVGVWELFGVAVFLIVCYLVVIPIFLEKSRGIGLATLLVATCLGVMLSGFCYVTSIIIGIPDVWLTVIVLVSIATANFVRYRSRLIPQPELSLLERNVCYLLLFGMYGGLTLVASIKMGFGEYP